MDKEKTGLQNMGKALPFQMPTPDEMISKVQYLRNKDKKNEKKRIN